MDIEFIFVAPLFDEPTRYSFDWCLNAEAYARSRGHTLWSLHETDAVKAKVIQALADHPEAILVHFDHGDVDCIYGNDIQHIIDLTNNSVLKNRISWNMNCLSAKQLGVDSYWRYATIYWGSWQSISFTTDALDEFKDAMTYGIKLRADGETDWNVILDKTVEHDNQVIDQMIANGKIFAASLLTEDRNARRVWTDKTPPPSQDSACTWRKTALRVFGQKAWRIPKPYAI